MVRPRFTELRQTIHRSREVAWGVDVGDEGRVDFHFDDVEVGVGAVEGERAVGEALLEQGKGGLRPGAGQRAGLRDRGVPARLAEQAHELRVIRGQSTGRNTATSWVAARSPATTPAIGARTSAASSSTSNGSSPALPTTSTSSHASASTRRPRSCSVSPSSSISAFGEPKRLLAPPTSRTPVSARRATARCRC